MATFAPVLLDGLLTRNPALETFPVRAGGITVVELAGDDRVEIVDLYGGQVAEVTALGAPVGLPQDQPATGIRGLTAGTDAARASVAAVLAGRGVDPHDARCA